SPCSSRPSLPADRPSTSTPVPGHNAKKRLSAKPLSLPATASLQPQSLTVAGTRFPNSRDNPHRQASIPRLSGTPSPPPRLLPSPPRHEHQPQIVVRIRIIRRQFNDSPKRLCCSIHICGSL